MEILTPIIISYCILHINFSILLFVYYFVDDMNVVQPYLNKNPETYVLYDSIEALCEFLTVEQIING